jgi:hypothetical protein
MPGDTTEEATITSAALSDEFRHDSLGNRPVARLHPGFGNLYDFAEEEGSWEL